MTAIFTCSNALSQAHKTEKQAMIQTFSVLFSCDFVRISDITRLLIKYLLSYKFE